MHTVIANKIFFLFLVVMGFCLTLGNAMADGNKMNNSPLNAVLIGASIGNAWKFQNLPERVGLDGFNLEFIPVYDTFDKGPAINDVMQRESLPDVVIIKECSVYFPGDIAAYKNMIKGWHEQLNEHNIQVVLATSVPVSKIEGVTYSIKVFIKNLLGKPNKMDQLLEYNDWLRDYSHKNGLVVLDLESALRISKDDRYMQSKFDRGDHVHLNAEAFSVLDNAAKEILQKL